MDKKEIITLLEKAIKESGKSFADIPKDSIVDFIRRAVGPNQKLINEIFLEMAKKATKSTPKGVLGQKGARSSANSTLSTAKVVNEPKKSPRKSVFSEIKKIT